MNCLLTGGNGFICRHLVNYLTSQRMSVTTSTRGGLRQPPEGIENNFEVGDIGGATAWSRVVVGKDVVVHLANRAHRQSQSGPADLSYYREVNVAGSVNLAKQCIAAQVKRFVYISSIQVHGERTLNRAFRYDDKLNAKGPYAISKMEAEESLRQLCAKSNMELVIIRVPLVYGRGVKGNLKRLNAVIDRGLPLPLGAVVNQRDLINIENLVSLIAVCMVHPAAAGQTFLCSDGRSVSTPELIKLIASARGKESRLIYFPVKLLNLCGAVMGRSGDVRRLTESYTVDISHTIEILDWHPPIPFEAGIQSAFAP